MNVFFRLMDVTNVLLGPRFTGISKNVSSLSSSNSIVTLILLRKNTAELIVDKHCESEINILKPK